MWESLRMACSNMLRAREALMSRRSRIVSPWNFEAASRFLVSPGTIFFRRNASDDEGTGLDHGHATLV